MSKYFFYLIIPAAVVLSGCTTTAQPAPTETTTTAKSGFTTISGTVQAQGASKALIKTGTGTIAVETYSVDFTQYNGQNVTATGKYSGDTLFISEVVPAP